MPNSSNSTTSLFSLSRLIQVGFNDLAYVGPLLDELAKKIEVTPDFLDLFRAAPDPDLALLQLLKLLDLPDLAPSPELIERFIKFAGHTRALSDYLLARPESLDLLSASPVPAALSPSPVPAALSPSPVPAALSPSPVPAALSPSPALCRGPEEPQAPHAPHLLEDFPTAVSHLRAAYRTSLINIAASDIFAESHLDSIADISQQLADAADTFIQGALRIAALEANAEDLLDSVAVIAFGKCGARELNYISDVDLMFVSSVTDERISQIAKLTCDIANAHISDELPVFELDLGLRPEGKNGPVYRTLESYLAYYRDAASNWEFQALLKARFIAGNAELGAAFVDQTRPLVWAASKRPGFVTESRAMRKRVIELIPSAERDLEIKLIDGGLRDVEFTAQLLQLVHGGADESIRGTSTFLAVAELGEQGYIARADAEEMLRDYRLLRLLEHRQQMYQMQRTHLMPSSEFGQRRLARSLNLSGPDELEITFKKTKQSVKNLHEKIYFRPLLSAVALSDLDDSHLSRAAAIDRLITLNFADGEAALTHISALTSGSSRDALIRRQIMPAVLMWLSEGANPMAGLLEFRKISEKLGDIPWFLHTLRDSQHTLWRLCFLLSNSRRFAKLFLRFPNTIEWLGSDAELGPRSLEDLNADFAKVALRETDNKTKAEAVKKVAFRELIRPALAFGSRLIDVLELGSRLTAVYDALLTSLLEIALNFTDRADLSDAADTAQFALIAMGRYGGSELALGSDADLLMVYRGEIEQQTANQVAAQLVELAKSDDQLLEFDIDFDLRPEGKNGPIARSFKAYQEYYQNWSSSWESQALVRARFVCGDAELGKDFIKLADSFRYRANGVSDEALTQMQVLKARMENERLELRARTGEQINLKLGNGGLSDVEWAVQLLVMQSADQIPTLQTTSTIKALDAALEANLISPDQHTSLRDAWLLASSLRAVSSIFSWENFGPDILPQDFMSKFAINKWEEDSGVSQVDSNEDYAQKYLAAARRSREAFQQIFLRKPE